MKKVIFVFGFLLCLAFGAEAKNLSTHNVIDAQTVVVNNRVNDQVSSVKTIECTTLTIADSNGEPVTYVGCGATLIDALLDAIATYLAVN